MVNLIFGGISPKELSTYCSETERTLQLWVKKVDECGWESLLAVKQTGRPKVLTDQQISEIKEAVQRPPKESGYLVWDGPTLSNYIKTRYDIAYGVRACQKLLHEMGFSLVRPQTYPSLKNLDNEARDQFREKLSMINQDSTRIVVCQDEVYFRAQTSVTRMWTIKGSGPKVMSNPGNDSLSYSGYVIPKTGELVVSKSSWFNYESVIQSFRDFLKAKPCSDVKRYCMILDSVSWHKKAIRLVWLEQQAEYADIRERMDYLNLPPYSPDLNPIEQVWC